MPDPVDVVLLLTSFAIGGTERQMVELARRLDPSRFRVHVALLPPARRPARRYAVANPDPRVPGAGLRQPGRGGPTHRVRLVVPVDRRGDRPHLRSLREHLRPARRGAGRRPRAHRQSPRDSHRRQVARQAADAAAGLSRRPRRGRQLERRARSARARGRPCRPAAADRQRPGRRAFRPGDAAVEHPAHRHGRQPAPREGTGHAARGRAAHPGSGIPTPASPSSARGRGGKRSRR